MSYCTKPDQRIVILEGQFSGMSGIVVVCIPETGYAKVRLDNGTDLILVPPTCYDYEVIENKFDL